MTQQTPTQSPEAIYLEERFMQWRKQRWSTEPLDRAAAAAGISALYQALGKPRPQVLFFSSPMMCLLAARSMFAGKSRQPAALWQRLVMQLWRQFEGELEQEAQDRFVDLHYATIVELASGRLGRYHDKQIMDRMTRLFRPGNEELLQRLKSQLEREIASQQEGGLPSASAGQPWSEIEGLGRQLAPFIESRPQSMVAPGAKNILVFEELERRPVSVLDNCATPDMYYYWLLYDCMEQGGGLSTPELRTLVRLWLALAHNSHWWFPYSGIVLLSERPRQVSLGDGVLDLEYAAVLDVEYWDGFAVSFAGEAESPREMPTRPTRLDS